MKCALEGWKQGLLPRPTLKEHNFVIIMIFSKVTVEKSCTYKDSNADI